MQAIDSELEELIRSIAPSGNLFLLLILPELRRHGLTYLAFYALQRSIREPDMSEHRLRLETGLKDYEVSRACRFLAESRLVLIERGETDGRRRVLKPTSLGRRIRDKVLSVAAGRLKGGLPANASTSQLLEATEMFYAGNQLLLGPFQFSLFDQHRRKRAAEKRKTVKAADGRSKRSEP